MKKNILLIIFAAIIQTGFSQSGCIPPVNLDATVYEQDVTLTWGTPISSNNFMVVSNEIRSNQNPLVDASPRYKEILNPNSHRDYMDVQFTFSCANTSGEAGVESDGSYIYSAIWNNNYFMRYEFDGTVVDSFSIEGVSAVRDMAYCEVDGYMYGANPYAGSHIFKMDFNNDTLIDIINTSAPIRAIAYDDDLDVFYGNNWGTDISVIDRSTGNTINTIPLSGPYASYYGFAYDNWSTDGPFVWGFNQGATGEEIVQFSLPDFTFTGVVINATLLTGGVGIAGGLFTQPNIVDGKVTLGGLLQNDIIFGLELADAQPPIPLTLSGYNVYRDGVMVNTATITDTTYLDTNLNPGEYQYQVTALYEDMLGVFYCESDPTEPDTVVIDYPPLVLGGNVFNGSTKLDYGTAQAYSYNGGDIIHKSTVDIDELGYYFFFPFQTNDYYVLAAPTTNSNYYDEYISTYYGNVYHWEDSPTIHLENNQYNEDINLIELVQSNTGVGNISGVVNLEGKDLEIDPATNILMLLLKNDNECISFEYTNNQGEFSFNQLENGTYKLLCEIIGKKMTPKVFVIDNVNQNYSGINLVVKGDEIILGIGDDLPESVNFVSDIYPNPVTSNANIDISVTKREIVKVHIYDITGKIIEEHIQTLEIGLNIINIVSSELAQGIKFLNIEFNDKASINKKFIVY